ncbi:unnamed protein product [Vicia faba]|uniref:Amine oxidase domain-containing protein n=1 Tax=Vicia faba TaxID=3906 RepID=A0AAV0ZYR9_VICFA|nr:unnamed protein product [Vicia faba]
MDPPPPPQPPQFSLIPPSQIPPPQQNSNPNIQPDSIPNWDQNPNLTHYLDLSVPKKRRRGRSQRNSALFRSPLTLNASSNNDLSSYAITSSSSSAAVAPPVSFSSIRNPPPSLTQSSSAYDFSDEIIMINKEPKTEAMIALSAGFPADSLSEEEIETGVIPVIGGIEQDKTPTEPSKPGVIIIGAGLAGLAAARQLMRFGFKVTVLEGRKRAGGRVYTKKMEVGSRVGAVAELGGSVLTGTLGNPLGIVARQLGDVLHKVRDKCPLYSVDGKPVNPDMDMKVESAFNRLLDKASRLRQLMGEVSVDVSLGAALETFRQVYKDAVNDEEMKLFNWHLANLEYANAGLISHLSLAFWDQDDPYDMGGDHCFLPGGNGKLVQALAENVPIFYEKTVHTIRYGSDGVQVIAGSQVFEGDMALCTVPLGVLKKGSIKFIPELPQRKLDGIRRLGFGLLNKLCHSCWWSPVDCFSGR